MPVGAVGQTPSRQAAEGGRQGSGRAAEQPDVPQLWAPTHWKGSSRGSGAVPLRRWQSSAQVGLPHPEECRSRPAG